MSKQELIRQRELARVNKLIAKLIPFEAWSRLKPRNETEVSNYQRFRDTLFRICDELQDVSELEESRNG